MKYVDKTDKYNACAVASKTCKLGGWCSSCMYAYPGNAAISGKPAGFEILGMVQGDYSPAFDKETAKKLFGCEYVDVLEVPEKCHIKVL